MIVINKCCFTRDQQNNFFARWFFADNFIQWESIKQQIGKDNINRVE